MDMNMTPELEEKMHVIVELLGELDEAKDRESAATIGRAVFDHMDINKDGKL